MLRKLLFTLVLALGCVISSSAQVGQGTIKGKVLDGESGEPVPFANVTLMDDGDQVLGTTTDFDGKYTLKPIPPGSYDIQVSYVGYQTKRVTGISVSSDRITDQDFKVTQGVALKTVDIVEYSKPLFEKDNTTSGETKTREEIQRMAVRSATDIAKTAGNGVVSRDDGSNSFNVRGSRSGNNVTFIDGIKVIGGTSLPKSAIEEVTVKTGGLSAQYGDVTGGVTTITTRGGLKNYFGNVGLLTSGFKAGEDDVVGLDNFGYNLFEFSVGGPILTNKDDEGKVKDAPLSFLLSGEYRTILNRRPSAVQLYKPTDEAEELIHNDPMFTDGVNTGVFKRAEVLTSKDFEEIDFQRNVERKRLVLNGKIDLKINDLSYMSFGGSFDRSVQNNDVRSNAGAFQLYNYFNNPLQTSMDYRVFGRYTQRFANSEEDDDKSLVTNAFFSIQFDYSKTFDEVGDERHQDNFFKYGHVGKFDAITEFSYERRDGYVEKDGVFYQRPEELTAFDSPIAYEYTPGNSNPLLANYTSSFYEYRDDFPELYTTRELVEGFGGLVNGSNIQNNVYNLWSHPGTVNNSYQKAEDDQYRLSGRGSADIGDHAITMGFEYEQRVQRNYSLNPLGLWQLGRGSVNNHIMQIDEDNYTVEWNSSYPTITYERLNSGDPSMVAMNMRSALGLDPLGSDYIDFDSYDIDVYKMEYFAAEQLINPANNVNLQYRGYDYLGNKLTSDVSLNDFFTEQVEVNGHFFNTRPVAAYQPIYIAGYLEDKFAFDDLIFRLGLRLDRFDANQPVLKDQFSFFPTRDAAHARNLGAEVPANIGDDYVVYVGDIENPSAEDIVGYRNPSDNTFYNASGQEINDPSVLEKGSTIAPWLQNPEARSTTSDMSTESFKDYEPQYTLMPRISFS
ncbi:MAG: carboxypeptidase regulatory-like domain-containing protein, partial [Vicingaceae bacterium]